MEEHKDFGCPHTVQTNKDAANVEFRLWAFANGYDISHRDDQPHYSSVKTRKAHFEYMNDWNK